MNHFAQANPMHRTTPIAGAVRRRPVTLSRPTHIPVCPLILRF